MMDYRIQAGSEGTWRQKKLKEQKWRGQYIGGFNETRKLLQQGHLSEYKVIFGDGAIAGYDKILIVTKRMSNKGGNH